MMILAPMESFSSILEEEQMIEMKTTGWSANSPRTRSISSPFTAYHDASTVTIYNDKPVCDLTIAIIDQETGAEVYSQEVSAENSGYVIIPVSDLGDGSYCLTISNPEAGYVYGYFNL